MGRPPSNNIDLERQAPLFEFGDPLVQRSVVKLRPLRNPIWTENKARLIERYLYYFVLITKHGTYIDGFAGPQYADRPDTGGPAGARNGTKVAEALYFVRERNWRICRARDASR